ncbi:kinase-like domain-containing protein [Dichotomocladium elegans]|nr:kinase-like domain-containing protein [Dichotomocladium elegans]
MPSSTTAVFSTNPVHPSFSCKYKLGEELGSGGFGFVMSATERSTGIERAVKFIYRNKIPASAWVVDRYQRRMPIEVFVLKHARHPNIARYIDHFEDDTFYYLVMELHGSQWDASGQPSPPPSPVQSADGHCVPPMPKRRPSQDLFECIEQHRRLDEEVAKRIFRQVVEAVAYLDLKGICHRDIKDENIVVDKNYKVKLIDFGSAVLLPKTGRGSCLWQKFYGTVTFASPEILLDRPYRAEPAEVWSLGVLLYTMLCGEVPFLNRAMAIAGRYAPPKTKVSAKCLHLIACMLERSPEKRLTIHQIVLHPWLRA